MGAIGIGNTVSWPKFLFLSVNMNGSERLERVGRSERNVLRRMPIESQNHILEHRAFFEIVDVGEDLGAASHC